MLKRNELIRTEKHPLAAPQSVCADLERTVAEYRRLVRVLAGVIYVHFPQLVHAPSKCFAVERLFHATADHPNPRFALVDRMFARFPSYLRRAAIEAAYGAVSSFVSNYARWQSGIRSKRSARPPSFARALEVNPPLYGGQCLKFDEDFQQVAIKVLRSNGNWGWTPELRLRGKLIRLPGDEHDQALSPTLIVRQGQALLACPVKIRKPKVSAGDIVASVDLGINQGATCAAIDSAGAVRARGFFHNGRHNDQLDKLAARIRAKAELTLGPLRFNAAKKKCTRPGVLSKGFCTDLYNRVKGLNRDAAQRLANAVIAFACAHGAQTIVLEHLQGWRPRGSQTRKGKGYSMKQRFHRWLHRLLVQRVVYKAEELGLRVAFVAPRGTSAWAHDGSGEVARDKKNYSLCTFASGKRYNADLNAALNIAARFIAKMLGVTTGDRPAAGDGKSSKPASRMPIVLADVWRHAGAPVDEAH